MFGIDPDLTREGCSIPVTLTLQNATGKNVMLLPIGACDDGAHSQNEKLNRSNFVNGVSCGQYIILVSNIGQLRGLTGVPGNSLPFRFLCPIYKVLIPF